MVGGALIAVTLYLLLAPAHADVTSPTPTLPPITRTLFFPTATLATVDEPSPTAQAQIAPTGSPTDNPAATGEPEATAQPNPTNPPPTEPPVPTATPLPTDTPQPTSPSAIAGLSNVKFWVDNPVVVANTRISFNFSVTNSGATDIVFGPLGVVVLDANGNNIHFHTSWPRWELKPGKTENWNDGVTIGTPGTYQLRLSACIPYNGDHCDSGGGDWYNLSDPVTVTVN